jgi:RimJ/RimL family protein N-acetyltransferase
MPGFDLLQNDLVLENARARLVPLGLTHYQALRAIAQTPGLLQHFSYQLGSDAAVRTYIEEALADRRNGTEYAFAIYDKQAQAWAGSTRYMAIVPKHKRLEIGSTWIGKDFQGTGLNPACKHLLLSFAFEKLGCNRVELKTSSLNLQSQQAMRKLGAVQEGTFRAHMVNTDGTLRDTVYFSYIAREWPAVQQQYFAAFIAPST